LVEITGGRDNGTAAIVALNAIYGSEDVRDTEFEVLDYCSPTFYQQLVLPRFPRTPKPAGGLRRADRAPEEVGVEDVQPKKRRPSRKQSSKQQDLPIDDDVSVRFDGDAET
jgi:hypothetical protein